MAYASVPWSELHVVEVADSSEVLGFAAVSIGMVASILHIVYMSIVAF